MSEWYIDGGDRHYRQLPEKVTFLEVGWYGAWKYHGEVLPEYDYVLERTCHDTSRDDARFVCSECGCDIEVEFGATNGAPSPLRYCPTCGARVVEMDA